jgi:hypothetical protein
MAIAASVKACWANTKEMPSFLRLVCRVGMFLGPLMVVAALVPNGGEYQVDSRQVTYGEFWTSAAGPVFVAFSALIAVATWGLAARRPVLRWALVAVPMAAGALVLFFAERPWSFGDSVGFALYLVLAASLYFYLFRTAGVRQYLDGRRIDEAFSAWARREGLHVTPTGGVAEVRTAVVVDDAGSVYHMWLSPVADGKLDVVAAGHGGRRTRLETGLDDVPDALASVYAQVESWIQGDGRRRTRVS